MPRFFPALAVSVLVFVPLFAARAAQAAEPALAPGEYVTEKGGGHLTLRQAKGGRLAFEIETVGANAHLCNLEGEIVQGKAVLETDEATGPCRVEFRPGVEGIEVLPERSAACRYFCGMRAGFKGLYLKPPAGCAPETREKARAELKRLYDRKQYAQAYARLEPVLERCSRILGQIEEGWIRNDLALTLYKQKDLAGCLLLLAPLAEDAAKTEEELREAYPPADAESLLPVWKATRTNLKLCRIPT